VELFKVCSDLDGVRVCAVFSGLVASTLTVFVKCSRTNEYLRGCADSINIHDNSFVSILLEISGMSIPIPIGSACTHRKTVGSLMKGTLDAMEGRDLKFAFPWETRSLAISEVN
jgi:hypothetical protein